MKSTCVICSLSNRLDIDREIVRGGNYAKLARENNVPYNMMWNHAKHHISRQLEQVARKADLLGSMDILGDIEDLIKRTKDILDEVETKKNYGIALQAIRELRGHYELLSKIAFALHSARLAELEQSQNEMMAENEEDRQAAMKRLRVLSIDELKAYQQLTKKIAAQDKSQIIEIPRPVEFKRRKPARMPEPEPEQPEAMSIPDIIASRAKKEVRVFRSGK